MVPTRYRRKRTSSENGVEVKKPDREKEATTFNVLKARTIKQKPSADVTDLLEWLWSIPAKLKRGRGRPKTPDDRKVDPVRYSATEWARASRLVAADSSDYSAFLAAREHFHHPGFLARMGGSEADNDLVDWLATRVFSPNISEGSLRSSLSRGKRAMTDKKSDD